MLEEDAGGAGGFTQIWVTAQHRKCPALEQISPLVDQSGAGEAASNAERRFGFCEALPASAPPSVFARQAKHDGK